MEKPTMKSRHFFTLDVFTDKAMAGNPLAVVLDSEGLDTARMQAIAQEFNLSETVFVSTPMDPKNRAALRIFTPARELPFAGHPTVGTAVLLATLDKASTGTRFVLEEVAGLVPCETTPGGAQFRLPKLPVAVAGGASAAEYASALCIETADIGFDRHVPGKFSGGVEYDLVPVKSLEIMARMSPSIGFMGQGMAAPAVFAYSRQTFDKRHQFHARMFAPEMGIREDPATGSAVAAFAGAFMAYEQPEDGIHGMIIEQGYEMGRPSQIELTLNVANGALLSATIGGGAVIVSEGQLRL
jgi:trans-2,3-dihydro-3-hydroxyanthranilate isomerase